MEGSGGSQGFNMDRLSTGAKIVGVSAIVFLVWTFLPFWYSWDRGPFGGKQGVSGFTFPIFISWFLAIVALVGVGLTAMGTQMKMQMKPGTVQLIIAGVAAVFTILGLVLKPSLGALGISVSAGISWGLFVGIAITLVWAYGAYMWHSEPGGSSAGGMGTGGGMSA
ncbi:MAG: hypothetical protein WD757_04010 [Actinomycetota bacterium]